MTFSSMVNSSAPLAGVRIVEFAGLGPVPFAAMLLADMGADVVRIDRTNPAPEASAIKRNRRVVEIDLKADPAKALMIMDNADAVLEGYRPGVMERLGLGPEIVQGRNPRIIYARMTGWGQSGPLASTAGHDINYIALVGALGAMGPADRPPAPPLNLAGDYGGGALYLAMGVLAALIGARRTGHGSVIDCAICDGAASMMTTFYEFFRCGTWKDERAANFVDGGSPNYRSYECSDGGFVTVAALEPQFYAVLRKLLGLDEPIFDRVTDPDAWPEITARLTALFGERTQLEWRDLLEGTDACFAPILNLQSAPLHPHLAERETFVAFEGVTIPNAAPRFSNFRPRFAPVLKTEPERIIDEWSRERAESRFG